MNLPLTGNPKTNLMMLSSWLMIQLAVASVMVSGCVVQEIKINDTKIKNQVAGVVKSIIPLGATNGRATILVEFEDGRIVNLNYDNDGYIGVFTIQKNKYNTFRFDESARIISIETVVAEVDFP